MKRNSIIVTAVLLTLSALFVGCAEPATSGPRLGEQFTLDFGESATIGSEGLTLRFDDVISDSRCPSDVVCVRAGEAEVKLSVKKGGAESSLLLVEQGLTSGLQVVKYSDYSIEFRVEPYPVSTRVIAEADYQLKLKVTKS